MLMGQHCTDTINGFDHASGTVAATDTGSTSCRSRGDPAWERLAAKVPTTTAFQCAPLQLGR
jgi:hypothetical protein